MFARSAIDFLFTYVSDPGMAMSASALLDFISSNAARRSSADVISTRTRVIPRAWDDLLENLKTLRICFLGRFEGYTGHITAGPREALDKSKRHWGGNCHENDGK